MGSLGNGESVYILHYKKTVNKLMYGHGFDIEGHTVRCGETL